MKPIRAIPNAFDLASATGPAGWGVAYLTMPDVDDETCEVFKRYAFKLKPGLTPADWPAAPRLRPSRDPPHSDRPRKGVRDASANRQTNLRCRVQYDTDD